MYCEDFLPDNPFYIKFIYYIVVACSVGMFYDEKSATCKFCERGTYQDKEGQTSCKQCPQVKLGIGIIGAVSITQCTGTQSIYFEGVIHNTFFCICFCFVHVLTL